MHKDYKRLVKKYRCRVIGMTGKKHWIIEAENGCRTTVPGSPGRGRALKNAEADIKRMTQGFYLQPVG